MGLQNIQQRADKLRVLRFDTLKSLHGMILDMRSLAHFCERPPSNELQVPELRGLLQRQEALGCSSTRRKNDTDLFPKCKS